MRKFADKAAALINQTGLDFSVFDKSGRVIAGKNRPFLFGFGDATTVREGGLIYFKITYGASVFIACIEQTVDPVIIKLLQQYFVDVQPVGGSIEQEISTYLRGKLDIKEKVELDKRLSGKRFYPVVFVVKGADKKAELTEFLGAVKSDADYVVTDDEAIVFLKSATKEYASCEELACVMYDAIKQERKIDVKVCTGGNATDLASLDGAIKRAYLALKYSGEGKDVCNYKQCAERVIYETMTSDQRKLYLSFMLDGVKDKTVFTDEDLTTTARTLAENSLSLTATAKQLFVHRNTLTHRIDKIYEDCGLDLRRFDDAKIFLAIAEIYAISLRNGEIK